jgi:hypothetical protein
VGAPEIGTLQSSAPQADVVESRIAQVGTAEVRARQIEAYAVPRRARCLRQGWAAENAQRGLRVGGSQPQDLHVTPLPHVVGGQPSPDEGRQGVDDVLTIDRRVPSDPLHGEDPAHADVRARTAHLLDGPGEAVGDLRRLEETQLLGLVSLL